MTGKLSGDEIDFAFRQGGEQTRFTGTVGGDRIVGTVARGGTTAEYVGTRH